MNKLIVTSVLSALIALGQDSGDFGVTVRKAGSDARAAATSGKASAGKLEFKGLAPGSYNMCTEAGLAEKRAKGAEAVIWREAVADGARTAAPKASWDIKEQTKRMTSRPDGSYCADMDADASGVLSGRIRVGEAVEVRGPGPARPSK